jgi:uncharacterized membrane protein YgcG
MPSLGKWFGLLLLALVIAGCGGGQGPSAPYDPNTAVPKGEPAFPPLASSWVVDEVGVLSQETIRRGNAICQGLQDDKIAEVVVIVMKGVKQPDTWATHYGRWLKLGSQGYSTEGGNNGVVWLIRPDAQERMTISVGRGLPAFSTVDYGKIMDDAKEYLNFGNFDKGVSVIVEETNLALRRAKAGKGAQ